MCGSPRALPKGPFSIHRQVKQSPGVKESSTCTRRGRERQHVSPSLQQCRINATSLRRGSLLAKLFPSCGYFGLSTVTVSDALCSEPASRLWGLSFRIPFLMFRVCLGLNCGLSLFSFSSHCNDYNQLTYFTHITIICLQQSPGFDGQEVI